MGRININFHVTGALALVKPAGFNSHAIPGKDLAMVLLNLPGVTYITGCVTGVTSPISLLIENTIEATNENLPDGTNVTCKYVREVTMLNGTLHQFDRYDGMYIEQPKSSAAYQSPPGYGAALPTGQSTIGSGSLGPCTNGHNWKLYTGLHSTEEFCTACGIKK